MSANDQTWVLFIASENERLLHQIIEHRRGSRFSQYRINDLIPVIGTPPIGLASGYNLVRLESDTPVPLAEEAWSSDKAPLIVFRGVTQHLHYTSASQSQELKARSRLEFEPSSETQAVLIPIGKSPDWWQLPQDRREAHFQVRTAQPGHTAIGIRYVDRVFRKLYHSRYLNPLAPYDFLTYFEFSRAHQDDFKRLLAELRDTAHHPEWMYVALEYEIWLNKIG
ncbi:MAG: chlorite dismutase family protein [Chloroflexi bacterium]|nr:chlorite dismutase family protein [Chloroflexota bacterium]